MTRIAKYLDLPARKALHNSFIMSNLYYCPLVWHFCGRQNNSKLEKIQERSLRIMLNDRTSSYEEMLIMAGTSSVLTKRLTTLLYEVFKAVRGLSPKCISNLFDVKETDYDLRISLKLVQPKRRTTKYGLRSISYFGAKIWNDLKGFNGIDITSVSSQEFKHHIHNCIELTNHVNDPICV